MSFFKKPLRRLTGSLKHDKRNDLQDKEDGFETPTKNGSTAISILGKIGNGNGTPSGASTPPDDKRKAQEGLRDDKVRRSVDKERSKIEARKRQSMRRIESEAFMRDAPPELTKLYKPYSMNMSKRWNHESRILFKDLDFSSKYRSGATPGEACKSTCSCQWLEHAGTVITFRARVHTLRRMSAKLVFIVFRQQTMTIQGVLASFKPKGEAKGRYIRTMASVQN